VFYNTAVGRAKFESRVLKGSPSKPRLVNF
jgi:hypothetical protein